MMQTILRKPELPRGFIPAREAAARLGVRRASLYAYVSRGAVRVVAHPTDPRARLYAAADIEDLIARKARGRRPAIAAATALDWGLPVLTTAISRIAEGHLFYRDVDAVELSGHASLEDVASLLWQCARNPFVSRAGLPVRVVSSTGSPVERAVAALNPLLPRDNAEDAVQATAIVRRVVASAIGKPAGDHPIHAQLAAAWDRHDDADTIRRALVLAADHELNASTFAARVAASTGASLAASVIAALAAFSGIRHGGATQAAVAVLRAGGRAAVKRPADLPGVPGFGHPLYPDGDPRARALLAACPPSAALRATIDRAASRAGAEPNLDCALASVQLTCGLPEDAAFSMFMIGRAVGWLAHAIEQQAGGKLIRPRATYPQRH